MNREVTVAPADWWRGEAGRGEVAALIAWLTDAALISTPKEAADVVDKPWKWTPEYLALLEERRQEDMAAVIR